MYRCFVPRFAKIAAPPNQRFKKGMFLQFELDEEEGNAVDELKDKLTSPPVLELPRSIGEFIVDPDASDGQLGCVLLQQQEE